MVERIAGVTIKDNQHTQIALRAVYGIGPTRAKKICLAVNVDPCAKISNLTPDELDSIRAKVNEYEIEGNLRRKVSMDIKRKMDIGCYQGRRHRNGLPVRGQRTKTNARTRKGKRKPVRK